MESEYCSNTLYVNCKPVDAQKHFSYFKVVLAACDASMIASLQGSTATTTKATTDATGSTHGFWS